MKQCKECHEDDGLHKMDCSKRYIRERAETDEEKMELLLQLYQAWKIVPHLRLGQLISNAPKSSLMFIEDRNLLNSVDVFARWLVERSKEKADTDYSKCFIKDISRGGDGKIYANIFDEYNRLVVSATLDYCTKVMEEMV